MVQERSNLQSTKAKSSKNLHPIDDLCNKTMKLTIDDTRQNNVTIDDTNLPPPPPAPNIKRNEIIYTVIDRADMSVGYLDQCGRFP